MNLECDEFGIKTVQNLIALYTKVIDHYVKSQSHYYLYFQNKLKQMLLKPRVVKLIDMIEAQKKNKKKQSRKRNKDRDVSVDSKNCKADLRKQSFDLTKDLTTAHQKFAVETILKDFTNQESKKKRLVGASLDKQKDKLRAKLEKRRMNSTKYSKNDSMSRMGDDSFDGAIKQKQGGGEFDEYCDDNVLGGQTQTRNRRSQRKGYMSFNGLN